MTAPVRKQHNRAPLLSPWAEARVIQIGIGIGLVWFMPQWTDNPLIAIGAIVIGLSMIFPLLGIFFGGVASGMSGGGRGGRIRSSFEGSNRDNPSEGR